MAPLTFISYEVYACEHIFFIQPTHWQMGTANQWCHYLIDIQPSTYMGWQVSTHTHTHSPLICRTPKKIVLIHHNTQNNAFSAFSFSWYGGEVTHCHHGNCLLLLPVLNSIVSLTGITLTYFYLCAKHICRCVWLFYWHFITFSQYIHTTIKRTQTIC